MKNTIKFLLKLTLTIYAILLSARCYMFAADMLNAKSDLSVFLGIVFLFLPIALLACTIWALWLKPWRKLFIVPPPPEPTAQPQPKPIEKEKAA